MSTKKCNKCQKELNLDCFNQISTRRNKYGQPRLKSRCKKCLSIDQCLYMDNKGDSYKLYRQDYEQNWRYYNSENLEQYENNRNSNLRIKWKNFMSNQKCSRCGFSDARALQWHHKDPSTKKFTIGAAIYSRKQSWDNIMKEIEKCECLCSNCHWITHSEIRNNNSSS